MASAQRGLFHVVSNGAQTDTLVRALEVENGMERALATAMAQHYCEPDAPVFTARITGMSRPDHPSAYLSILRHDARSHDEWLAATVACGIKPDKFPSAEEKDEISRKSGLSWCAFPTERASWERRLTPGMGYCLTTYKEGDWKGLQPFAGEPFVVPIRGAIEQTMDEFWNRLHLEARVAIVGKEIPVDRPAGVAEPISRYAPVKR